MKKFILLLLLSTVAFSQQPKVSPYYPDVVQTGVNELQTQITYFDLNFVNSNIQDFVQNQMQMSLEDNTKFDLLKGKGTVTFNFIDDVAINTKIQKLHFAFSVEAVNDELVIKSLKVTGDADRLINFYLKFWSSPLNFQQLKSKGVVTNAFQMDNIVFAYNAGKPTITITSNSSMNFEAFKQKYLEKIK